MFHGYHLIIIQHPPVPSWVEKGSRNCAQVGPFVVAAHLDRDVIKSDQAFWPHGLARASHEKIGKTWDKHVVI